MVQGNTVTLCGRPRDGSWELGRLERDGKRTMNALMSVAESGAARFAMAGNGSLMGTGPGLRLPAKEPLAHMFSISGCDLSGLGAVGGCSTL